MQIDGALRTDVANRSRSRPVAPCTARQLPTLEFIPWGQMDTLYEAVVQCVEETVINVLVAGETMIGRDGHRSPAFPRERLASLTRNQQC